MRIQGFDKNYILGFNSFKANKTDSSKEVPHSNIVFLDKGLLGFGIPDRVAIIRREHKTQNGTTRGINEVMLYDKHGRCFHSANMSDGKLEDAEVLLRAHGVENIVYVEDIRGGQDGTPSYNLRHKRRNESEFDSGFESEEQKASYTKAVLDAQQKDASARTYLKGPAILDNTSHRYKMSLKTFIKRTRKSKFDIRPVLHNLNASTKNGFMKDNIKTIIVSPDGTKMRMETRDGKKAALDFNNGKRFVYDSDIDDSGFGSLIIMDQYGPVIKEGNKKIKIPQFSFL